VNPKFCISSPEENKKLPALEQCGHLITFEAQGAQDQDALFSNSLGSGNIVPSSSHTIMTDLQLGQVKNSRAEPCPQLGQVRLSVNLVFSIFISYSKR
jgi:hypothetical protein